MRVEIRLEFGLLALPEGNGREHMMLHGMEMVGLISRIIGSRAANCIRRQKFNLQRSVVAIS